MTHRPAVVFDIGGTLLDSTGTVQAECHAVLSPVLGTTAAAEFAAAWQHRVEARTAEIVAGQAPWAPSERLQHEGLAGLLPRYDLEVGGVQYEALNGAGSRSQAFPDAAAGLASLAEHAQVIGLTNTDLAASSASCAGTGLRWHALLSTDSERTLKPRPEAYLQPERRLGINPARSWFVAAHPWDLRGAAETGYRSVYLPRPHADGPEPEDDFDATVASLEELLALVTGGAA
ncbi:HAD-IA family hydrolase [Brachybacterium sacelli]|uniref:2-haloacid dehalogenase n=1 Tax=Brachybacterium sacelli TaxID=173364 RepID=A0ABS4WXJ3_9MICO|nr:HAD-IA family hydrolase [Brachybacterium sacelli]MBP2380693.1 2-haloacid dehalogenase [Brachybacterium sacelli]